MVVAAFKKYTLASLIASGTLPSFPRYTAAIVQRHLKSSCSEYVQLADAYKSRSAEQLRKVGTQQIMIVIRFL